MKIVSVIGMNKNWNVIGFNQILQSTETFDGSFHLEIKIFCLSF